MLSPERLGSNHRYCDSSHNLYSSLFSIFSDSHFPFPVPLLPAARLLSLPAFLHIRFLHCDTPKDGIFSPISVPFYFPPHSHAVCKTTPSTTPPTLFIDAFQYTLLFKNIATRQVLVAVTSQFAVSPPYGTVHCKRNVPTFQKQNDTD